MKQLRAVSSNEQMEKFVTETSHPPHPTTSIWSLNQANLPLLLRQILGHISVPFPLQFASGFIADSFATSRCSSSRNPLAKPSCENSACCSNVGHLGLTSGSAQRHCARKSIATGFHVGKRLKSAVVAGRGVPATSSAMACRSRFTRPPPERLP